MIIGGRGRRVYGKCTLIAPLCHLNSLWRAIIVLVVLYIMRASHQVDVIHVENIMHITFLK